MLHHISPRQKLIVMGAVMSAMFLVALDQTIIATALGSIVRDFNDYSSLTWIVTAYLLTTTVTVPIAGKLSDLYGRRRILMIGVVIFTVASLLSGLSSSVLQLVLARALQGIGGGIITANAFTIVGDLFPPRERGKWQGIIGAVFGLSSVVGPLLGGFLTDPHQIAGLITNWRWTFWINVPIGIISMYIIARYAPHSRRDKNPAIDIRGAVYLSIALISIVLAVDNPATTLGFFLEWSGWNVAAFRIALWVTAIGATVAFVFTERHAREPIIPLSFFANRNYAILAIIALLNGAGFLGSVLYLTQFNQQVYSVNATTAGLMLVPFVIGIMVTSIAGGRIVSKTGQYKIRLAVGLAIAALALAALTRMDQDVPYWIEAIIIVILGMGLGFGLPIITIAVQNEFTQRNLGAATASVQLFRTLGSTIGTALLGTLLTTGIATNLASINSDPYITSLKQLAPTGQLVSDTVDADAAIRLNSLESKLQASSAIDAKLAADTTTPDALKGIVTVQADLMQERFSYRVASAFSRSLSPVFWVASGLLLLAAIATLFLREKPLRTTVHHD